MVAAVEGRMMHFHSTAVPELWEVAELNKNNHSDHIHTVVDSSILEFQQQLLTEEKNKQKLIHKINATV